MSFIYNYIFPKKQIKDSSPVKEVPEIIPEQKIIPMPARKKNKVFLVIEKSTNSPLGIFDKLELAKSEGSKITYNNCIIIPYTINDRCRYLFNSVYESK